MVQIAVAHTMAWMRSRDIFLHQIDQIASGALRNHKSLPKSDDDAREWDAHNVDFGVNRSPLARSRAILWTIRSRVGLLERSESSLGGSELNTMCCTRRSAGDTRRWGVT